jgi:hypothetical protein
MELVDLTVEQAQDKQEEERRRIDWQEEGQTGPPMLQTTQAVSM